ncbi:MAG: DNA gyrase inhibitor YacG [Rhizobiales bacterium 32-66-8]|nr:MAG: DNA gyrase inhibitor YacG [Rhizobiales bacterium 32-66-8]
MADNENTAQAAGPSVASAASLKPCAVCGKPAQPRYKPFCSPRCADIDLGRWLKGSYVIPGEPVEETETGLPPRERDEDG